MTTVETRTAEFRDALYDPELMRPDAKRERYLRAFDLCIGYTLDSLEAGDIPQASVWMDVLGAFSFRYRRDY
jgi:hypothetical protein